MNVSLRILYRRRRGYTFREILEGRHDLNFAPPRSPRDFLRIDQATLLLEAARTLDASAAATRRMYAAGQSTPEEIAEHAPHLLPQRAETAAKICRELAITATCPEKLQ